jgi:hypothetical protein
MNYVVYGHELLVQSRAMQISCETLPFGLASCIVQGGLGNFFSEWGNGR